MEKLSKVTQPLFLLVLLLALMILLRGFLVPFCYGLLIALIIYPFCKKLENRNVPRALAIFISVLLVTLLLGAVIFIFILQLKVLNKEMPELMLRLEQFLSAMQKWINDHLGISVAEQDSLVLSTGKSLSSNLGKIITGSFSMAAETLFSLVIIPLYSILLLFYRRTLVSFIGAVMGEAQKEKVQAVLSETIHIYSNYIKGMLWVYLIVGVLNSIGLLALGVDYAILLGMTTAFMTIIPYIGIIVSAILPISLIWIETGNPLYPLGVVGVFTAVQYLEANVIFPYVVGKQLGVNTLVSIIAILLGGVIWGVSGMILFLPFAALLKIISGHMPALKPFHQLLESTR